jgi:hypothetical protein
MAHPHERAPARAIRHPKLIFRPSWTRRGFMLGRVEVNPAELRVGLRKDRFIELGAVEHLAGGQFLPVSSLPPALATKATNGHSLNMNGLKSG